uniref:Uncharacterized protein n=1 Tax=Schistosoma japonicum TaxID=6182 RepID=Q5C314_SCHJA|nr:unknown [Schistosoma japonicum]
MITNNTLELKIRRGSSSTLQQTNNNVKIEF